MEIIKTIILLCQITSGSNAWTTEEVQLKCQKYYIECLGDLIALSDEKKLINCIKNKKS